MGDEEEQRQTLDALMKAIDEEPLSARSASGHEVRVPRLRSPRPADQPAGRSKADRCRQWVKDLAAAGYNIRPGYRRL